MIDADIHGEEGRWQAVCARDLAADGRFVFAVASTGIYCRPSCPARRPGRAQVRFFDDGPSAAAAGFRACRRCDPDSRAPGALERIAAACRLIDAAETLPAIDRLAATAGLGRFAFTRLFRRVTGTSPRDYAAARRAERFRTALGEEARVIDAAFAAGFETSSRSYAAMPQALGMSPRRFRSGGTGERIRHAVAPSTLGLVMVAATERGIAAIEFGEDAADLRRRLEARFPEAVLVGDDPVFATIVARVVAGIEEPRAIEALPLDVRGTAFQQRVWAALKAIPAGERRSYAEVAAAIEAPRAVRAVARACAANTLAVAIPCHRVIGRDGALTGYRWGIDRKRTLLEREAALQLADEADGERGPGRRVDDLLAAAGSGREQV